MSFGGFDPIEPGIVRPLCQCGCGMRVGGKLQKYASGHSRKLGSRERRRARLIWLESRAKALPPAAKCSASP